MTHDRDEVKADYMDATIAALGREWGQLHTGHIVRSMADEIVRLRSILSALREPSEAVSDAAFESFFGVDMMRLRRMTMRTRDEVLREFGAGVNKDYADFVSAAHEMADRIVRLEKHRDEFHRLYKAEVLAARKQADRIRELEAASGEPVACERCAGLTNALGFFASVIKCGEGWSVECENIVSHAFAHPPAPVVPVVTEAQIEAVAKVLRQSMRGPMLTPGSQEAVTQGCTCPVLDNGHGTGAYKVDGVWQFWVTFDCPLHQGLEDLTETEVTP